MIEPELKEPFPDIKRYWVDPKTGLSVPKFQHENIVWRSNLLRNAEHDTGLQDDLLAACQESVLFWINAFTWTFHQFDVDPSTGKRMESKCVHQPFITWDIQDKLFDAFINHFKSAEDILIDKCRDMGASWCCVNFIHWLWLFRPNSQLLEMSRNQNYVDQTGNMKALFPKHDYINKWLPDWMLPPLCSPSERNRTKMHMMNEDNGSCIDGESTTEFAASGDRRSVILLDEFAKVDNGMAMRSATRDAAYMRIVNSTPAGPGTEYSRWKNSGQIKVFVLPFYEHPDKGKGRYVKKTDIGGYEIRSPWFEEEEKVRSKKELAREVLHQDIESGDVFFTTENIDKHIALYGREPKTQWDIKFKTGVPKERICRLISSKDISMVQYKRAKNGKLQVWTNLILNRPDQTKSYIFGIDVSKGQGASNSVISIKCKETNEKIAEWADANVPPYEMAYIIVAIALWCGGGPPHKLPFLKWENNGPGWDVGRIIVKELSYPYYYRNVKPGKITDKKTKQYGFQTNTQSKFELLSLYDRILAHGSYVNHSVEALEEAKQYIYLPDGGVAPAILVEEDSSAKKTHGDRVMADALTLEDKDVARLKFPEDEIPVNSIGYRFNQLKKKKDAAKKNSWRRHYDFTRG